MDNAVNMVVYADVYKTIRLIPIAEERAAAAMALLDYGCGGLEYEGDSIFIQMIMQQAKIGIDKAQERYNKSIENGKKGGRTKQFKDEDIIALKSQGMTNKEVAAVLGCSERTVQRSNVSNRQNIQTDKTDTTKETDKTDTDRQQLNNNKNNNNNNNNNFNKNGKSLFSDLF